jgi:hypothetical protein
MKLSNAAIDVDRQEKGDWVDDIPEMGDLRLKVRGLNNGEYRALEQKLIQALPRAARLRGQIGAADRERIQDQCLLDTVLIDWDRLTDDDGNAIAYDRDLAGRLLSDPAYARFRGAVIWAAAIVADGDAAEEAEIAKN